MHAPDFFMSIANSQKTPIAKLLHARGKPYRTKSAGQQPDLPKVAFGSIRPVLIWTGANVWKWRKAVRAIRQGRRGAAEGFQGKGVAPRATMRTSGG
jgi:hypothetical protein